MKTTKISLMFFILLFVFSLQAQDSLKTQEKGTFIDPRDDQTYEWVKIGNQIWMAENLNYSSGKFQFFNNDLVFWYLYNWKTACEACPNGWHLPSDSEWKELEMYLGMSQTEADKKSTWRGFDEGTKLKSVSGWDKGELQCSTHGVFIEYDAGPNVKIGTNTTGFSASPSMMLFNVPKYLYNPERLEVVYIGAFFWTSTSYFGTKAWYRELGLTDEKICSQCIEKDTYYLSIRCVKD